jgi:REP element-mobilizing transposase RayT
MPYDPDTHHRRSIRLHGYDYSRPGVYFVTLCTHSKEFLFGTVVDGQMKGNGCGEIVSLYWNHLPKRYPQVRLDSFVVMPNHIHGIVEIVGAIHESPLIHEPPGGGAIHQSPGAGAIHESPLRRRTMLLSKIMGYLKMNTSKRINEIRGTPERPVWQRNYYEHVIRDEDELGKIRRIHRHQPAALGVGPGKSGGW